MIITTYIDKFEWPMNNRKCKQDCASDPQHLSHNNDEIGFLVLCRKLCEQITTIAIFTTITTLIAGGYAFTANDVWTSKAIIMQPKAIDLGEYFQQAQVISRNALTEADKNSLTLAALKKTIFTDMQSSLASIAEKKNFITQNEYFLNKTKNNTLAEKKKYLNKIITEDIRFMPANENNKYNVILCSADSAVNAQRLLSDYIGWNNKEIMMNNKEELQLFLLKLKADINHELKLIVINAKESLNNKIDETVNALVMAKIMNILNGKDEVFYQISDESLYKLGVKSLTARLDALKIAKIILPKRYYELQEKLKELDVVKLNDIEGQSFSYIDEPSEPFIKDKPKRVLIVLFGFFSGLIIGCFFVSIRNSFKTKN